MGKLFDKMRYAKTIKIILVFMIFMGSVVTGIIVNPPSTQAACCHCPDCEQPSFDEDLDNWPHTEFMITIYIWMQLLFHQMIWFDLVYWQQHMLPMFMHIGNHLAGVGALQVMIIGQFIDAQQHLEAQRDLQIMHARAHKDYHASTGMCEFATRIQSLAASERKGEANALILSERSTDRLLGNVDTGAWSGTKGDVTIRLELYQREFCNSFDNNNSLSAMCSSGLTPPLTGAKKERLNKDIDYQRAIEDPWTIGFDLTGGGVPSHGDEGVALMANNLYGYESFSRVDQVSLLNSPDDETTNAQQAYLDLRAIVAKTKVAENSFNALMAMKGEGTAGSRDYLESYLKELGVSPAYVTKYIGANPSYNAQMEVLTKKAYQNPLFYTNLYGKPANVERKGVAMQAIGLIQKFDLLKSYLRTEASMSVLLELSVFNLQRQVEANIHSFDEQSMVLKQN